MGNNQSIFFPDNPKRRDRADQLANDCQNFKSTFDAKHAEVEQILGPYKAKLDNVLRAFGCTDLDQLDDVVQQRATGQALVDWNKTKGNYDKTQIVDQVIMGAMGTAVGALAGGFGFFVGLAVTSDILLALGVIGAIFDIVNGAVQRSKLRDAIDRLFESRLKVKQVLVHIQNLDLWLPSIVDIYQTYEEVGYDPDKIIERFKTKGLMKPLQSDLQDENFHKVASDLRDMDNNRGSWMNEDPNWQSLADRLQSTSAINVAAVSLSLRSASAFVDAESLSDPPPPYDTSIKVQLSSAAPDHDPDLPRFILPLELVLLSFPDDESAEVLLHMDSSHYVSVDRNGRLERGLNAPSAQVTRWIIRLTDPGDFDHSPWKPGYDPSSVQAKVNVASESNGYRWHLDANGEILSGATFVVMSKISTCPPCTESIFWELEVEASSDSAERAESSTSTFHREVLAAVIYVLFSEALCVCWRFL
ncbi:hypothetical protein BDN71DRAFT_695471 [Pleurotus eryngii]|uniref:Uncharacterized protein n=1 Tax=Pleurotus eryngii TaxID=5323 RepID=A0A9P6DKX7_PLEER|nr:hypothetical protein BDN71DRAFT_695471 [Pleurotus eryngii]